MILNRLHVENFRQLFGPNDIVFARPGDRNVTVVIGTNGAGKTTLLNAITWCLYGKVSMPQPADILSNRAAGALPSGGKDQTVVELTFEAQGSTFRLRRQQRFKRRNDGAIERVGPDEVSLWELSPSGESKVADKDPAVVVEQLIPHGLSTFFFFRGEDMEALASAEGEEQLRTAVETFLELRNLDRAKDHLDKTGQRLERQIRENSSGETLALSEEIQSCEDELRDLSVKSEELEREQRAAKTLVQDLEQKLALVDELRPFVDDRTKATTLLTEKERHSKLLVKEVAEVISRNAFLALAPSVLSEVERLASEAVKSGELPAKIKPRFVDDLLNAGSCICGRELTDTAREHLQVFRAGTGVAGLEEAISTLRGNVTNMHGRAEEFQTDFANARGKLAALRGEVRELRATISSLTSRLEGFPHSAEDIQGIQRASTAARESLQDLRLKAVSIISDSRNKDAKLRELKQAREREKAGDELVKKIEQRRSTVDRLHDAVSLLRDQWCDVVRQYLDIKLQQTWARITQLERSVEFTRDFQLSVSEFGPEGKLIRSAPSQANQRALSLAFIGALISLAKEVDDYVKSSGDSKMLYQGGVYGLVMDAPFATMDAHFKRTLPQGLVELVPQIVLVTSHDQWDGEIEDVMGRAVGKAYALELHNPRLGESSRTVRFRNQPVSYEVSEPGEANDWTVIKEIA
jgi:DNA sulfur modification protein DndD